jgi:hypothetical protein
MWEGEPNCNARDAKKLGKVFETKILAPSSRIVAASWTDLGMLA